jgi:hypothetical protein
MRVELMKDVVKVLAVSSVLAVPELDGTKRLPAAHPPDTNSRHL